MSRNGSTPSPDDLSLHDETGPDPVALRRAETLLVVLMAGFALRAMHEVRERIPGGLSAGLVLLDVLHAGRPPASGDAPLGEPDPSNGADAPPRSVGATHRATGLPRETVRRHLNGLVRAGWLKAAGTRGFRATERGYTGVALHGDGMLVADFLLVALRIRGLQRMSAAELNRTIAGYPWQGAMTTRHQDIVDPLWQDDVRRIRQWIGGLPAASRIRCAAMADRYLLHHMIRLRPLFEGDLMLPLIVGEIAHRNISGLSRPTGQGRRIDQIDHLFDPDRLPEDRRFLPVNAYSLSVTMRIPDATMRRKIARLVARGLIVSGRGGTLSVSNTVRDLSAELNASSLADLRDCADALARSGLLPPPAGD